MNESKIWMLRGDSERYSDNQIKEMIKEGKISPEDYIATREIKNWIRVKDSIYQFYIKGDKDETI